MTFIISVNYLLGEILSLLHSFVCLPRSNELIFLELFYMSRAWPKVEVISFGKDLGHNLDTNNPEFTDTCSDGVLHSTSAF